MNRRMMFKIAAGIGFVLALVPMAALALVKPARVLVPRIGGAVCPGEHICLDDPARWAEARTLYRDALTAVQVRVGAIRSAPRAVFCGTEECFAAFGGGKKTAQTIGTLGLVIGPRGWRDYYVRHEMIHHWQAEQLSLLQFWNLPAWLKEGMAYALSDDPRPVLAEPMEGYRQRFRDWDRSRNHRDLATALREFR